MRVTVYLCVNHYGHAKVVKTRPQAQPGVWVWELRVGTPASPPMQSVDLVAPIEETGDLEVVT